MEKITVIITKNPDNTFWCRTEKEIDNTILNAVGDTVKEAKQDLFDCYEELKEMNAEDGIEIKEVSFVFQYDVQSFFEYFSFLNVTEVARRSEISPSLLRQYVAGTKKAGESTYERLAKCLENITKELQSATF